MSAAVEIIAKYLVRVAPGLVLATMVLTLIRKSPRLRIVVYLALFALLRDAMTPLGLWSFGTEGFFWIRLTNDPAFLVIFGVSCLGMSLGLYFLDRDNQALVRWRRGNLLLGVLGGLAAAIVVVAPCVALYWHTSIESRGGPVPSAALPAILVFAFLGNLLEELLFRGYVFGWLAEKMSLMRAGLASGVVFAFCHIYLASTVTDIGYPLLVFTLWEGMIAGVVGAKGGVLASTMTHGGAIFLLSSGLF
ncbi:MAG TPA: CPBP family intramembrane glutamic endopeptidase [Planctomycetaceae bacterium]|jgi:membrane protease YdiL (CAAX protease family)|nr:CPBP family intramembrane glutamic endopeptidase [Planctomycetaceae bacterium]